MISFQNNLPLVRFSDGQVIPFERNWLAGSLARAAERAGYKKWWLAPHVTESVTNYLQQDFDDSVVTINRLEKAVQSVLQVIGYADVAGHFHASPPPARISLAEVARDAGHGYELVFFDLLRSRLREALDSPAERVEICDAHSGVKLLRSAKNWRRDCSGLLDEIVSFVRTEIGASKRASELQMQLS
ncbi:MAG TPA: hypothetical protein PLS03_12880 [Terrimicrobiaceae bacterium]|nr:hypothetical protein [Terrimicrobiaceae bacterium]